MTHCAVYGCSSNSKRVKEIEVSFYRFPKNWEVSKLWVEACFREDPINEKNARICSDHFLITDYKRDFTQSEYVPIKGKRKRTLKDDAVPTLKLPTTTTRATQQIEASTLDEITIKEEFIPDEDEDKISNYEFIDIHSIIHDEITIKDELIPEEITIKEEFIPTEDNYEFIEISEQVKDKNEIIPTEDNDSSLNVLKMRIIELEKKNADLLTINNELKEKNESLVKQLDNLKANETVKLNAKLQTILSPLLTKQRINAILNTKGKKRIKLSNDDIAVAKKKRKP